MTKPEAQELAYVLVDLGDAIASVNRKVYAITKVRVASAAKRVRFLLGVAGEDETKNKGRK